MKSRPIRLTTSTLRPSPSGSRRHARRRASPAGSWPGAAGAGRARYRRSSRAGPRRGCRSSGCRRRRRRVRRHSRSVRPKPCAAFSALTIARSIARSRFSPGTCCLTASRPARPTTSPQKRMFKRYTPERPNRHSGAERRGEPGIRDNRPLGDGFRVRPFGSPRNDNARMSGAASAVGVANPPWPCSAGGRHVSKPRLRQGQLPKGRYRPRGISGLTHRAAPLA